MKSFLQNNCIEMYLTHHGGKSVVAERFIKTLKNKRIYRIHDMSFNKWVY